MRALAAVPVAACGYPPDRFAADKTEVVCALVEECGKLDAWGYDDAPQCLEELEEREAELAGPGACPGYDEDAARTCVEDWEAISCADLEDPDGQPDCLDVCNGDEEEDAR